MRVATAIREPTLHRAVALLAVCSSAVVLTAGLILHTGAGTVRVGMPAAVVLSGAALSLPVWAGALAYGLHREVFALDDLLRSRLLAGTVVVLGGLLVGFVLVLTGSPVLRPAGDALYAVASVGLVGLAGAVLVVGTG